MDQVKREEAERIVEAILERTLAKVLGREKAWKEEVDKTFDDAKACALETANALSEVANHCNELRARVEKLEKKLAESGR